MACLAEAEPDAARGGDGPLAGVPFAVKELLAWPGLPQSMGSRLMAASPAPCLSPYAARIAGSGLNVICSAASSEFGLLGSTESALHGATLNPWGEGLSAGGSSGGSAALVAAGIVPMAHGDDAGGSLRGPAALNERLGHHVDVAKPPAVDGQALSDAFFTAAALAMSEMAATAARALGRPPGPAELEPFTLELIEWAATFPPDALAVCEQAFAGASRAYLAMFEECDAVLSPALPRVSWPMGRLAPDAGRQILIRRTEEMAGYTAVHNAAGCPAMTVPLGRHGGLPVGIHFAARPGADRPLLALAYELEAATPWADTRPDTAWLAGRG